MLTKRQSEVVGLIARGYRNSEIADALEISEETVKTHVRKTLVALGARNRTHAAVLAQKSEEALGG